MPDSPAVPINSSATHLRKFQSVALELITGPAVLFHPDSLLLLSSPPPSLNLLMVLCYQRANFRVQAPLRLWNHQSVSSSWQLETSPALWPLDLTEFCAAPSSASLTVAWIHANKPNRVDHEW